MSKKDAILKAATKMFAAQGFERAPVRKIAEKVDLSVPGMFHYFPSKEDILNEIMVGFLDEGYKKLKAINNEQLDPVQKVEGFCKFYVDHYAGNLERRFCRCSHNHGRKGHGADGTGTVRDRFEQSGQGP